MSTRKHARRGLVTKSIEVRIVVNKPDGTTESVRHHVKADPGKWLSTQALVNVLRQESDMLARELPAYDFKLVRLSSYRINLIGNLKGSDGLSTMDAHA